MFDWNLNTPLKKPLKIHEKLFIFNQATGHLEGFLNDYKLYGKSHHESCVTKIGVLQKVNRLYLSNFLKNTLNYYICKPTACNSIKK